MNIFNENSTPCLGIMLAIFSLIPVVLSYTFFKVRNKRIEFKSMNSKNKILAIINSILYFLDISLLIFYTKQFDIKNANIWFGIMCFFYIIYYEMYIRYLIRERNQKELYKRLLGIKIPLFISMSMSLFFAGVWSKNVLIVVVSFLFALTNCYSSYKMYIKYFTEYRDLYDSKRKFTGKKILKDGIKPKGLKYITVVVFIFNPVNKKWLIQKRSKDKGGKWATTSGHPISGQTSVQGMVTEIKEELGISVSEKELNLVTTMEREDKFVDIYYLEKEIDLDSIHIQKDELTDVKWMSDKEIEATYLNNMFKKTHYNYYREYNKIAKRIK